MTDHEPNNSHPVTKAEVQELLSATTAEFKKLFPTKEEMEQRFAATKSDLEQLVSNTKSDLEQLLAEQTSVLLEAVGERLDKKLYEKFDIVIAKLDGVMKKIQAHREEDVVGAEQLRRHDDQIHNHELRLKALELQPQQSS